MMHDPLPNGTRVALPALGSQLGIVVGYARPMNMYIVRVGFDLEYECILVATERLQVLSTSQWEAYMRSKLVQEPEFSEAYTREAKAYGADGRSQQWQIGFERGFKEGWIQSLSTTYGSVDFSPES